MNMAERLADYCAHRGRVRAVYPGVGDDLSHLLASGRGRHARRTRAILAELVTIPERLRYGDDEFGLIAYLPGDRVVGAMLANGDPATGSVYRVIDLASSQKRPGTGTALMAALASVAARTPRAAVRLDAELQAVGFYAGLGMCADRETPRTDGLEKYLLAMTWNREQILAMSELATRCGLAVAPLAPLRLRRRTQVSRGL
jgi:hypothetical protein